MSAQAAITGLGVACPLAVGHDALWRQLELGATAVCDQPPSREGLDVRPATAFLTEFEAERYVNPRKVRKASGASRLAAAAASLAIEDGGLPADAREEAGVVLGTCFGSPNYYLAFHEAIVRRGTRAANAVLFTEGVYNAPPAVVSQLLGLRGPSLATIGGEETGLSALVLAVDKLALGDAQAFLAGGVEEYCDRVQASLLSEGRIGETLADSGSSTPSLLAEGAAVVLLEACEAARARGASPYADVAGVARARPGRLEPDDPATLARAIEAALDQASATTSGIDLVVGGGGGGPLAARERAALAAVGYDGPVWGPKAAIGEGFAFTSALRVLLAARACRMGRTPLNERAVARVLVLATSQPGGCVAILLDAAS